MGMRESEREIENGMWWNYLRLASNTELNGALAVIKSQSGADDNSVQATRMSV